MSTIVRAFIWKTLSIAVNVFAVAFVIYGILFLTKLIIATPNVQASSSVYNPNFCLGGWEHPQNASGEAFIDPKKSQGGQLYDKINSAFLDSTTAAQLFCGYFSVLDRTNPPKNIKISFNWSMRWPVQNNSNNSNIDQSNSIPALNYPLTQPLPTNSSVTVPIQEPNSEVNNTTSTSNNLNSNSSSANSNNVDNSNGSTNTNSSTPSTASTNPAPPVTSPTDSNQTNLNNNSQSTQTNSNSSTPPSNSSSPTPPSPSNSSSQPTSAPTTPPPAQNPPTDTTPTNNAPQTFNTKGSFSDFLASLISEKVLAQTTTNTTADTKQSDFGSSFLQVSYSLDGIRWVSIGQVNKSNWQNYSVNVPVSSWNDLKHLQISLNVIPSIDPKPDIYLESMDVTANYNKTVSEVAGDSLASVGEAVGLLDTAEPPAPELPPDIAAQVAVQEVQTPVVVPPPKKFEKHLTFATDNVKVSSQSLLPWQDDQFQKSISKENLNKKSFSDRIENAGKSFFIDGSCKMDYYVVLLYRNETDYIKKPSSYVSNLAEPCVGGRFTYDLSGISTSIPDGDYYLMIAEQGSTGPWVPTSDLQHITIGSVTE